MQNLPSQKTKRSPLILLFLIFFIPVLIAYFLFKFQSSFQWSIKPNGTLISPPIPISTLNLTSKLNLMPKKWQLIYLQPSGYTLESQQYFELLQRIPIALGKHQSRIQIQSLPHSQLARFNEGSVLIVDPKGFLMMVYPGRDLANIASPIIHRQKTTKFGQELSQESELSLQKSDKFPPRLLYVRGILQDMRRLLRFSND